VSRAFILSSALGIVALTLTTSAAADSPLIAAAKRGDEAAVRAQLRRVLKADSTDPQIRLKADSTDPRIRLKADSTQVNAANPDGTTALYWAARGDHVSIVRLLIGAGARVNDADRYGITPLALAAINGSAPVIKALLDAGADAKSRVGDGETVLMAAARTGRVDAAALLLDRGAEVNAREPWQGETAVMWAAGENHGEMVKLLASRGAGLDARSNIPEFPKVKVDLATMVTTALPRGGLTALMFAARQGAREGAQALIDVRAPLNTTDPDGTTALTIAIINAHFDVAAALIEGGADLNAADAAGMTPLYAAVDMKHQEPMINRPLQKATGRLSAQDLISLLLKRGANPNLALRAPLLMRQHSTGDPSLGEGATPLMRAAKVTDLELMRELLAGGANPNLALRNGTTVLMNAASRAGRPPPSEEATLDALALLLKHGADVKAANSSGQTPLHLAVGRGDRIVRYLAENGAPLEAKDSSGRTPLDIAMGVQPTGGATGRGGRGGGRGGPPAPPQVFESTAALLKGLMRPP
jgi:ankyrin repeat protein